MYMTSYLLLTTIFLRSQVRGSSDDVAEALSAESIAYNRFMERAIQVSMNVSITASAMTRQFFDISDKFDHQATFLEAGLTRRSGKCDRDLNVSKTITDMRNSIEGSTKCLINEASKNAKLETDLTQSLNQYQAHSVRGRRAMVRCGLAVSSQTVDCLEGLSSDLRTRRDNVWESIVEIKKRTILRLRGLQIWVGACTSGASKSIMEVKNKLGALDGCQP